MHADRFGLGIAVGLHVLVLAGLLAYAPARGALLDAVPIMVEILSPPRTDAPKPAAAAEHPKPKPVARPIERPVEPPILTSPAAAPSAAVALAPPPVPSPAPSPAPAVAAPPAPPATSAPVFRADYLENPAPPYPSLSRRLHEEGKLVLRVLVNAAGTADQVQVNTSSGHARLDESAADTVKRWKFVPARRGAEAVPAWVLIPISFHLES